MLRGRAVWRYTMRQPAHHAAPPVATSLQLIMYVLMFRRRMLSEAAQCSWRFMLFACRDRAAVLCVSRRFRDLGSEQGKFCLLHTFNDTSDSDSESGDPQDPDSATGRSGGGKRVAGSSGSSALLAWLQQSQHSRIHGLKLQGRKGGICMSIEEHSRGSELVAASAAGASAAAHFLLSGHELNAVQARP